MTSVPIKRLVTLVLSVGYFAAREACRLGLRLMGRRSLASPLVVLTYHGVAGADATHFKSQMRELKRLVTPVFADHEADGTDQRLAAVTFDDGFQSVFDTALPILAELGIPATLFVPTAYLDGVPGWIAPARRHSASGVVASADTLAATSRRLVKIGSHTVSHPHLASLEGTALDAELVLSKQTLERIMGGPITMLSFPYGSYDAHVLTAARIAGYERMFANVPVVRAARPFLIGRINVTPRDWRLEFRLKVQGAYNWMGLAVPAKRAVFGWFGQECGA